MRSLFWGRGRGYAAGGLDFALEMADTFGLTFVDGHWTI